MRIGALAIFLFKGGSPLLLVDRSDAQLELCLILRLKGVSWQARFGAIIGLADIDREEQAWQESASRWNEAIGIAQTHANSLYESFAIRGLGETWLDRGAGARRSKLWPKPQLFMRSKYDSVRSWVESAERFIP